MINGKILRQTLQIATRTKCVITLRIRKKKILPKVRHGKETEREGEGEGRLICAVSTGRKELRVKCHNPLPTYKELPLTLFVLIRVRLWDSQTKLHW